MKIKRCIQAIHLAILFSVLLVVPIKDSRADQMEGTKPFVKSSDLRFVDLNNGVILDNKTNLMWMKSDYWQLESKWVNWYTAQQFNQSINNKNFAGHSDWRLPTPEEAESLYNRRRRNLDKDGDKIYIDPIFPKGSGWATWTSYEKKDNALVVSYKNKGGKFFQNKISGADAFFRLVRGPVSNYIPGLEKINNK